MQPPPVDIPWTVVALFAAGVLGCLGVWTFLASCIARREPVLPCAPRRPVPWRGSDVLLILMVYFFVPPLLMAGQLWMSGKAPALPPVMDNPPPVVEKVQVAHPVIELLQSRPGLSTWLVCLLAVVVVAPVVEEVLFRLVVQGWLESLEARTPALKRLWPRIRGFWPIGLASLLFALLHFRTAQPSMAPAKVESLLAGVAAWNLVTLGMVATVLIGRRGASWQDLGIVPQRLLGDVWLGLVAFLAMAVPLYLLQISLQMLTSAVAVDPITLSLFAMVLGLLYFRTHRLVPSIVLHMALNGTSLLLAGLLTG